MSKFDAISQADVLSIFRDKITSIPIHVNATSEREPEADLIRKFEEFHMIHKSLLGSDITVLMNVDESMRPKMWQKLLHVLPADCESDYIQILEVEPKPFDKKIRDDSFRTYKGDTDFWGRVSEESIIRVLNALSVDFGYVQGMNVLLGPFIYTLTEPEAYCCLKALLQHHIPRYVLKNLDGAQDGAKVFAKCLHFLDPVLHSHILSKIPDLSIFSLRYILTLFANAKPLHEILKLWDVTLAIGVHFNIFLLCSRLILLRETILKEKRGAKILTIIEDAPVVSRVLIEGAACLSQFVAPDSPLFNELVSHAVTVTSLITPAPGIPAPAPIPASASASTPTPTLFAIKQPSSEQK